MATDAFGLLQEIVRELSAIRSDHEQLEGRVERMFRKGTVTDVDPKTQTYRQVIGLDDDGKDVKGPWVPYAQFAGARKIHTPPTVGQQFLMISPDGDHEQAHGIPLTFSDANASPSQSADEHVDAWGKVKETLTDKSHERDVDKVKVMHTADGLMFDADGTTFHFSKNGFAQTGGKVTHDDLNIGSTHKHGQVQPGGGETGVPEA